MTIAALITEGIGPGGTVTYVLTGGLDLGTAPPPPVVIESTQGMGPGWNLFGQPHQPSKTYVHDTIEADIHRALEAAEEAQSPRAKRQAVKELREVAQSVITEAKAASDDAGGQHLTRIAQSLERAMRLEMSATALLRNVREALELERLQQEDDAEALMLIAELI